jgi:choline dehydrogenase-like flavoprotein
VDEKEVPYTYDPQHPYNWVRVRLFGGRSLFWSRQSFRLSDYEFKGKSHDGYGDDWPIALARIWRRTTRAWKRSFACTGRAVWVAAVSGWQFCPDDSPWSTDRCSALLRREGKMGVPVCKARSSLGVDGLASSVNLLLPDAIATGKLRAIPNVVVRELSVDKNTGLVNEAHFVDRLSRREMSVKARVVVLAAGTLESTRLLLNSKLANSSGVMGHYLIDQVYGPGMVCSVPDARDGKGTPEIDGRRRRLFRVFATSTQGKELYARLCVECLLRIWAAWLRITLPRMERNCREAGQLYGSGFRRG